MSAPVVQYLDCGCAVLSDGTRALCPTCGATDVPRYIAETLDIGEKNARDDRQGNGDAAPLAEGAAQHIRNAQAVAWVWRDMLTSELLHWQSETPNARYWVVPVEQLAGLRDALQAVSDRLDAARLALQRGEP